MAAILRIPEKSGNEIRLAHKFVNSNVQIETGNELLLEAEGKKIDAPNTIIKYLVNKSKSELLGADKAEQAQVEEWLSFCNQSLRGVSKKEIVSNIEKKINEHLSKNTFFVGNHLTIVDVVVFGLLHSHSKSIKVNSAPNTLRWFDLIQNVVIKANNLTEEFPLFEINLDDVPEPVAPEPAKKADKKGADNKKPEGNAPAAAKVDDKAAPNAAQQQGAKPKKEKKKGEKKPAAAAPAESDQHVFSRIDLRVGYIKSCKAHEGADSLFVEQIDLGEPEGPRTIVSGLRKFYTVEQMENRFVFVVANLKPANMRGVKSFGMVLCASNAEHTAVELLEPVSTNGLKPGQRVVVDGIEGEAMESLPPKKKYWEAVQPDLNTKDDLLAYYGDKPLIVKTESGESIQLKAVTIKNGGIS
ncbi:hypothetical protein BDF20DRAFT_885197 [Mycotypha africana]|uniref:uncharacterized protein n=1 Tax=Mycotypha africana TaxID=64632 RepID=UPI0023009E0D|nr:uncharacterized protein BDF20DRAFT_885197 [Mycotypha africana]KAI8971588.1 hypothetical protein BDF20DRAFT_885197 [Mycotypha africana]